MAQRTALVTGFYGQDGSLLAEYLLERDYRVLGVTRPGAIPPDTERRALAERCEVIEVDFAIPHTDWANEILDHAKPDEIYYLAATHRSSDPSLRDDPAQQQRMVEVNFTAPLAIAHALLERKSSAHLVVATSSQMFTPQLPPLRVNEGTPHAPATFYGVTKANCVDAIRWLRERQQLRASCAILFNHESARRTPDFASRRITRAVARIAAGLENSIELVDLSSQVDFSSAQDVVAGLHVMATAESPTDCVVASGALHRLEDVCRVAFASVGLDWRDYARTLTPPGDRPALVGDPRRLENLGWIRKRSFESWVSEMVDVDRRALREG